MRILALDTTCHGCSVAVTEDRELVIELNFHKKETHSRHIMGMIDHALNASSMDITDIDGFAVSCGPGSFTGLRIGLSTIKGLAAVTDKPLVGVSSLDALVLGVPYRDIPVCAVIDARKNEVYVSHYIFEKERLVTAKSAYAVGPEALCDGINTRTVFVGTGLNAFGGIIRQRLGDQAVFMPPSFHHIRACHVAELSFNQFASGLADQVALITPHYVRKSDAEINRGDTGV